MHATAEALKAEIEELRRKYEQLASTVKHIADLRDERDHLKRRITKAKETLACHSGD